MSKPMKQIPMRGRQQGVILVVSLLLLLVLTVLGVAVMKMTNMQERMAGNTRDVNLALQGSEAALREAEDEMRKLTERPPTQSTIGCTVCQEGVLPVNIFDTSAFSWTDKDSEEFGVAGKQDIRELDEDPRYVVEDYMFDRDDPLVGHEQATGRVFYTITSRSTGASGQANVVLQSTYARRY